MLLLEMEEVGEEANETRPLSLNEELLSSGGSGAVSDRLRQALKDAVLKMDSMNRPTSSEPPQTSDRAAGQQSMTREGCGTTSTRCGH